MSIKGLFRLLGVISFLPMALLAYHVLYFLVAAVASTVEFYRSLPGVSAYLSLYFLYFAYLYLPYSKDGRHGLRLLKVLSALSFLLSAASLITLSAYLGVGILEFTGGGIGYALDGLIVGFLVLSISILTFLSSKRLVDWAQPGMDGKSTLKGFSVAYSLFALYFLGGALFMPTYASINAETAFPLIVVFLVSLALYLFPALFLVYPIPEGRRRLFAYLDLGISALLLVLLLTSFLLFPNAMVEGYPSLVLLEMMGSLYLLPYGLSILILAQALVIAFSTLPKKEKHPSKRFQATEG